MINRHDLKQLKRAASEVALKNKSAIYLVGSSLDEEKISLDIDIIMVVDEERFSKICGYSFEEMEQDWLEQKFSPSYEKWVKFHWKQKEYFESMIIIEVKEIDFKIQLQKTFDERAIGKNILRLDMFETIL